MYSALNMIRISASRLLSAGNLGKVRGQLQGQRSFSQGQVALVSSKLDDLFPKVVDFPARHIGPRKHEAKDMLKTIGYSVRLVLISLRVIFPYLGKVIYRGKFGLS